ncbi:MAG: hypothetical protein ACI9P5_004251 [Saprospiraceae bacterium]|jgi:hypothetical protein
MGKEPVYIYRLNLNQTPAQDLEYVGYGYNIKRRINGDVRKYSEFEFQSINIPNPMPSTFMVKHEDKSWIANWHTYDWVEDTMENRTKYAMNEEEATYYSCKKPFHVHGLVEDIYIEKVGKN